MRCEQRRGWPCRPGEPAPRLALESGQAVTAGRILALGLVALAAGSGGWLATDALEANNDFCNVCHLSTGLPLHAQIREGFDAVPAVNLAGIHAAATEPARAARPLSRCIDCHGGVGAVGRTKVKLLAAKDALVWLSGDFDEPDHMEYPLGEADCRKCHLELSPEGGFETEETFHGLSVHNADLGVTCVECHTVHDGGDDSAVFFMNATRVREQCGRCHSEFK
jgi:nitrate/TMAO reductase-like tetraheme cytochrome c subunit